MEMSREDIQKIIDEAVSKMAETCGGCACNLSPEPQRESVHLWGMIKDLGSGDHAKGIEAMRSATSFAGELQALYRSDDYREDMRFVRRWRKACERTGSIVLGCIVLGVIGLLGAIGASGWWSWIESGGK